MANTFIRAKGYDTGKSKVEEGLLDQAKDLLALAEQRNVKLVTTYRCCSSFGNIKKAEAEVVEVSKVPEDKMILDIGLQQ